MRIKKTFWGNVSTLLLCIWWPFVKKIYLLLTGLSILQNILSVHRLSRFWTREIWVPSCSPFFSHFGQYGFFSSALSEWSILGVLGRRKLRQDWKPFGYILAPTWVLLKEMRNIFSQFHFECSYKYRKIWLLLHTELMT